MADTPKSLRKSWRIWQKLLAYATLIVISALAVYYVDLKIHMTANNSATIVFLRH